MDRNDNSYGASAEQRPLMRLALEALADAEFYARLKEDPQGAAESVGVQLSDSDASYLSSDVHWAVIDSHIDEMREALHLGIRQAGPLW